MAFDESLAQRVRDVLGSRPGVTEKKMFGGIAFLLEGKMFCGVLKDELLARVGPEQHQAAIAHAHVRVMDFTGKPMHGYVFVGAPACASSAALGSWVERCLTFVQTLPVKRAAAKPGASKQAGARNGARSKPVAKTTHRAAKPAPSRLALPRKKR